MNIKAKTPSGREVYIAQFVVTASGVIYAITINDRGYIVDIPAEQLTVVDTSYLWGLNNEQRAD